MKLITYIAKGDSTATINYLYNEDKRCLSKIYNHSEPPVILPYDTALHSTQQENLPLSDKLSSEAQKYTVLMDFKSSLLISLDQLCDDNCQVFLNNRKL